MTVEKVVSANPHQQAFEGLSTDIKPNPEQGVVNFASFIERDTGMVYRYLGGRWFLEFFAGAGSSIGYGDSQILMGHTFSYAVRLQGIPPSESRHMVVKTAADVVTQIGVSYSSTIGGAAYLDVQEVESDVGLGIPQIPHNINLSSAETSKTLIGLGILTFTETGPLLDAANIGGDTTTDGGRYGGSTSSGGGVNQAIALMTEFEERYILYRVTNLSTLDPIDYAATFTFSEDTRQGLTRTYTPPIDD